jgi:starch-binding outer membrane protein SusE/F
MKKTIKYIFAFIIGCMAFTSCEDPYANQTVAKPGGYDQLALQDTTGFVAALKQASVTILPANLNDSLSIITCTSVPTLADSLAKASYKLQFSNTADFASYHVIPFTFKGKAASDFKVSYKDLNDTLFFMNSTSGQRDVYAKVSVYVTRSGLKTLLKSITLKFQATPIPLKAFTEITPRQWYIVGLGGHWDNNVAGLGGSLIPLSVVPGKNYNDLGDGKFVYTGYFKSSDGFKILRNIGNWDNDIWGMTGSSYVYNGGGNISVAADGYYTITLNSITNTLTIVSATAPTASYTSIGLIGAFNGWGTDVVMTPSQTTNNHIWYTTQTFATDGGCKFRANGAWTTSWGGDSFPIGMSGGDIPAKAGTYKVLFNDVDGCFYFIKQ